MRFVAAIGAVLVVAGCGAIPKSSGVMQLGPDTYRVAARGSSANVMESQKMALTEAQSYCMSAGKELMTIGTRQLVEVGGGPFEVTFRCLRVGDQDLYRPNLQPTPDTIIQVK